MSAELYIAYCGLQNFHFIFKAIRDQTIGRLVQNQKCSVSSEEGMYV